MASAGRTLDDAEVTSFARVALAGVTREYPHKSGLVLRGPEDLRSPRELHPAFYGCFDWHSAVHSHWMLVRLLKLHPGWGELRDEAVAAVDGNLTAANLQAEAEVFGTPYGAAFERTYGWAWLLRLAQELHGWDDEHGRAWARNLEPLEARIVELATAYLPKLRFPLRTGQHGNTAFALAFFLDYARSTGHASLEALCAERAQAWFGTEGRHAYFREPSGHDFFSPGLQVADLMHRLRSPVGYEAWLDNQGLVGSVRPDGVPRIDLEPVAVDDVADGHLVHLAGLDLTRAWTLRAIGGALPETHAAKTVLETLAQAHEDAGLAYVFSGDYAGEHWLGSFAVFLLTEAWRPAAPSTPED